MRICFLLLLQLTAADFFCQTSYFKNYTIDEGLAHSQINTIYQDKKGYLWMLTFGGGISRFDGHSFKNYGEKDGLIHTIIRGMVEDQEGTLWVSSVGGGVMKFNGKSFHSWNDSVVPLSSNVYVIITDKEGRLWFGTDSGVYSWDSKKMIHYGEKNGIDRKPVMNLMCDSKGRIWVASWESGLYCYNGTSFQNWKEKDGLSSDTVMYVLETSDKKIYAATFRGVSIMDDENNKLAPKKLHIAPFIDNAFINCMEEDREGNLCIGSNSDGLVIRKKNGEIIHKKIKHGLPGNNVYCLKRDTEGNLWLSCWGFGLSRYTGDGIVYFGQESGLGTYLVNSITQNKKGAITLGTSRGVYSFSSDSGKFLNDPRFPEKNCQVMRKPDSFLTVVYGSRLIEELKKGTQEWDKKNGFNATAIKHSTIDKNGDYWLATWSNGAGHFKDGSYTKYMPADGFCCDYLNAVFIDSKGTKWFGTWDHGLCGIDTSGKIRNIRKSNGLPNDFVNCITEDAQGRLWLGTFGSGISVYDPGGISGKDFINISSNQGLVNDGVTSIFFDGKDAVWAGTNKGLCRISVSSVGGNNVPQIRNFLKSDGFTSLECLVNSIFIDTEDKVWIGTKKGLACLIPDKLHSNTKETTTILTGIQLFFVPINLDSLGGLNDDGISALPTTPTFNYTNNHLTFEFTGICFSAPEKVRYRYIMDGLDADWSPETTIGKVTYSGLQPGKYTFKVISCNNLGVWNKTPLAYSFTITPPFYRTTWFYILSVCVLVSGTWLLFRYRTRKLEQDKKELEQKVVERTSEVVKQKEIIEEKNKDITDSINYARKIQEAILPAKEEKYRLFPQAFIYLQPRDIVSGDFYWFTEKNGKKLIAAVDCTGHGVPGAFMSMIGNAFLNEIVNERGITEPGQILNELREMVIKALKQTGAEGENRDGMDMALICMEGDGKISFAGANNPLWIIRSGSGLVEEIRGDKQPIGLYKRTALPFNNHALSLSKGDFLYIFTDGYADQFGGTSKAGGKKFKYKNLKEFLLRNHQQPPLKQEEHLENNLKIWMGNLEQVDDILIIGIRV